MLTNKYAEGYPAKRYYGGCEYVDKADSWRSIGPSQLLVRTMRTQPHSGSQANLRSTWRSANRVTRFWDEPGARWPPDPRRQTEHSGKIYHAVQYGRTRQPERSTT